MKRLLICLLAALVSVILGLPTAQAQSGTTNQLMVNYAVDFLDRPYAAGTLEVGDDLTELITNCDEVDCTTLVEYVTAMTLATTADGSLSEHNFMDCLLRVRYRDGQMNGYPSRLHYFSDWIYNGVRNGFLDDVTRLNVNTKLKLSLSYMSSHPEKYPQLVSSTSNLAAIKKVEQNLSGEEVAYLPEEDLPEEGWTWIKAGDIIAFTTDTEGLDVAHVGIAFYADGRLGLLHASSTEGKVVVANSSIKRLLKQNKRWTGIRVLRVKK